MRDLNTKSYTDEEIFKTLTDKILVYCFGNDAVEGLNLNTDLIKDLYADNLDVVEVILSIEDEFDIDLPAEEENNMEDCTIQHYVDLIKTALGERYVRKETNDGRNDQSGDDHQEVGSPEAN